MDGFVDLRHRSRSDSVHDSFWPSFTDVMMVVVMIFIMASLIMVVKNWDLVAELRATIRAEREAQEFARNTDATNKTLAEQLAETQHQLSEICMQLMRVMEESQVKTRLVDERDAQLVTADEKVRSLYGKLNTSIRNTSDLQDKLKDLRQRYDGDVKRFQVLVEDFSALESEHRNQQEELKELRRNNRRVDRLYAGLQGEYDALKVKYDKLIKPARTAKGKYVVDVVYEKHGNNHYIKYKDPESGGYTAATRQELDSHLAKLKESHPGKLYIKIIIPSNSSLSYNEAWRFTADVLAEYDYCHQK